MFLIYLLGVVLFFSFLANFAFRKIFKSLSWVDKPDGIKKLHKNDIPLSGGISFIASLIFAVLIFDFFAGVNFNLSWNGFFVGDSIKQDNAYDKGKKLFHHPGIAPYFIRYIEEAGKEKFSNNLNTQIKTALSKLDAYGKKQEVSKEEIDEVSKIVSDLMDLL